MKLRRRAAIDYSAGAAGSNPGEHIAGEKVWLLDRKAFVLPFLRGIFGTPASGSYSQVLNVPDIRIVAAEMYVTNVRRATAR